VELDSQDVQRFLGIDRIRRDIKQLREIPALLERLEFMMATAREQLDNLSAKVDDLVSDVRAAREALEADRENLSEDGQAALDTLAAKVDAFDAEVGDADGSDAAVGGDTGTDETGAPVTEDPAASGEGTGDSDFSGR